MPQVRGGVYWGAESAYLQRVVLTVSALPPPPAPTAPTLRCAEGSECGEGDVYTIGFDETNEHHFRNIEIRATAKGGAWPATFALYALRTTLGAAISGDHRAACQM